MKIRELFTSPERWTQGTMARDSDGNIRFPWEPEAVCWCLMGAAMKCYPTDSESILSRIRREVGVVPTFNDMADFSAVRSLVERLDV